MFVVIVVLCIVISHTTARPSDDTKNFDKTGFDGTPKNCSVQAWNEQFEKIEERLMNATNEVQDPSDVHKRATQIQGFPIRKYISRSEAKYIYRYVYRKPCSEHLRNLTRKYISIALKMKSFLVIAGLCVVISYTTAQRADNTQHSFTTNFDRRFRNVEDNLSNFGNRQPNSYGDSQRSHVTQNGAPSRYNNGNSNVPNSGGSYGKQNVAGSESPTYRGKLPNIVGDAGFDRHFRDVEENLSKVADKLSNVANGQQDSYGDNQRSRVAQNSAPSHNDQASGANYGSSGTHNIAGSESTTYRVDTNPNNCNVQAWNEQFERVEGRAGFSNSGPHPNPVVRCHQETVVRSKDFGNGVGIQSSTTTGTGSYRSTINRSTGDPGSEQLAKSFGAY